MSLTRTSGALGAFYRPAVRTGKAQPITAAGSKPARRVDHLLAGKRAYDDPGVVAYNQLNRIHGSKSISKRARQLSFELVDPDTGEVSLSPVFEERIASFFRSLKNARAKCVSAGDVLIKIGALAALLAALWTPSARAATTFTGDRISGIPVITQLSIDDLEAGKTHRFMFQGAEMTGQFWYVPVMVAKGAKPGKRILLMSGVHGDELNPVAAVQQVFTDLNAATLTGSVIGIVGPSRPGVEWVTRTWPTNNVGTTLINPNRTWPGKESGNPVERHCWLITNRLIKGNVDVGVDFHTGGTGIDFALFVFAYAKDPESRRMAELFPVDQIMADPGLEGTLEYALVKAGIPALTVELGGPRGFDPEMIRVGVEGSKNLLSHYKLTDRPVGQTAKDRNVFRGNKLEDLVSVTGGFVEVLVKLNDEVKKGLKVAIQKNAFGDIVHEYTAGVNGRVAIIGTDAIRERSADIVTILTSSSDCPAEGCPYHEEEP